MGKKLKPPRPPISDRDARVKCHLLVQQFYPAVAPEDMGLPVVQEQFAAHASVARKMDELARKYDWPVALTQLSEFVRKYRMPLIDGMRDRNDLPDTFGEYAVRQVIG